MSNLIQRISNELNSHDIRYKFYVYVAGIKRYSKSTVEIYLYYVNIFVEWIKSNQLDINNLTLRSIITFIQNWTEKSNITKYILIQALKKFGEFLVFEKIWKSNFFELLENPKYETKLPAVLSLEQINKILMSIPDNTIIGVRDRTIYNLIFSTGIRNSELCNLQLQDIIWDDQLLIIQNGKGGKDRYVPFRKICKNDLMKYLKFARPFLDKNHCKYIFLSKSGEKMLRQNILTNLKKYANNIGIKTTVHMLRHTFATLLFENGADLSYISLLLGHANLQTTTIYAHVNETFLKKEHEEKFPGHKNIGNNEK